MTKLCSHCNATKPLETFVKDKKSPLGYVQPCKECANLRDCMGTEAYRDYRIANGSLKIYVTTQICAMCKKEKSLEEFYRNKKRKRGRGCYCKVCHAIKHRQYTPSEKAKETQRKLSRQWDKENPEKAKKSRKNAKIKRRILKKRVTYQTIDPQVVFERDKWICQICYEKVSKKTIVPGDKATLDHIIPLTKNGSHVYSNVVLAHHRCNSSKGNRIVPQQLRLY